MTHYGFSQIPRLITRGKEIKGKKIELSLIEKGLYTCLKDICGDEGECYYALRTLADEINTSISTLSRYIPVLRDKGVINATKKVRGPAGNKHEIWHISMVSIWEENDALYAPASQDCFNEKQSFVSNRNTVSNTSNTVSVRNKIDSILDSVSNRNTSVSDSNKDCFYLNDRVITSNSNNLEEDKVTNNIVARRNALTFTLLTEDDFQDIEKSLAKSTLPHQGNDQKGSARTTTTGRNNTPLTPAGSITPTQEPTFPQSPSMPENQEPHVLDNAIPEPPCSATDGLTDVEWVNVPPTPTKPSESLLQTQEMPLSVPAHDESSNQATEQQQASGDDPIATGTIENPPAQPTKNQRGRGKSAGKEKPEKPQLSDEEKAKEAQYAERRRFWQNKINERRGGPLRTRGLCINETECLNTLVREFDDIDIGKIDRHLATEHWKYKKNPAEIGGKALLDESRPTLQYLKTKGGQLSNGSSQQTPTPIKASMTHDEANKLMQDAIEQAKQYNIVIVAQAVSSKNNPDAWGVRVKWDDGSKDGFPFPPIKVREQWDSTLIEIRKIIKEEAKQVARSAARMQEVR